MSRAVKIVILPESMVSMISLVSLSIEQSQWNEIFDMQTAEGRNWEIWKCEEIDELEPDAPKSLLMVFKFEIDRKFESSDIGKPGFFRRGEMRASLNFDGNAAWVKGRFARCEMRMEKIYEHDFSSEVGM